MPADLLLALFAVTLLANAFLVGAAIRSLRRGSGDPRSDRSERPAVGPGTTVAAARASVSAPVVAPVVAPVAHVPGGGAPIGAKPDAEQELLAVEPVSEHGPPAEPADEPEPLEGEPPADPAPTPAIGEPRRRGRRRFLLPSLDADHEKVSRSIESFLGGLDGDQAAPPAPGAVAETHAGQDVVPVGRRSNAIHTIALIAVAGIPGAGSPAIPRRNARAVRRPHDDPATEDALAVVERAIRSAARATDVVSVGSGAVVRVDLPATGEVAARAYLRRVRATVDQVLESNERPLRLAVATATVLDEPIRDGLARAELRLTAALDAVRRVDHSARFAIHSPQDERSDRQPRAAAD